MRKNRLYQITRGNTIVENMESENTGLECKPRLLLHSCCGPCSTSVIEKLMENFDITILYYNPNITEQREYLRRKINQIKAIEFINQISRDKVKMIDDEYCTETYFEYIKGYEDCEEGGARCSKCFSLRLYETARIAKEEKFHIFGTTLTEILNNWMAIGEVSSYPIRWGCIDRTIVVANFPNGWINRR